MFVWVAVDTEKQLCKIKENALYACRDLCLEKYVPNLPFHVSLKISFFIEDEKAEEVISFLKNYFSKQNAFEITPIGFKCENGIIWIEMLKSPTLCKLHEELDDLLLKTFNVLPHEFDLQFKFHTTLFYGAPTDKLQTAIDKLLNVKLPNKIWVDTFIIGTSKTGEAGTYGILDTIKV